MEVKLCARRAVPKMLLSLLNIMLFAMLSFMFTSFLCVFLNMFMFNSVKTILKLKLMKYILLCPSDIYSMIQSLQTGVSKTLLTHIRLPLKDKGH